MVQNLISGLDVCQQLDQTDLVSGAFRECTNDKIEVFPGKSCPTVRLNHRVYLHSIIRAERRARFAVFSGARFEEGRFFIVAIRLYPHLSPTSMPIRPFQFFKWLTLLSLILLLSSVAY
jgi:hypothetical protein